MQYWQNARQMSYFSCDYRLQEEQTIHLGRLGKGLLISIQCLTKTDNDQFCENDDENNDAGTDRWANYVNSSTDGSCKQGNTYN